MIHDFIYSIKIVLSDAIFKDVIFKDAKVSKLNMVLNSYLSLRNDKYKVISDYSNMLVSMWRKIVFSNAKHLQFFME